MLLKVKTEDAKAQEEAEKKAKAEQWKEMPLGSKTGGSPETL